MVARTNPDTVVSSSAYLLFYRRRSDRPLGSPLLQKIADQFRNPDSDNAADGDSGEGNSRNPSRSPAGNGSRLADSSRNGSSSAFMAGAGVLGAGSASAGTLRLKGAAAVTVDADSEMVDGPPAYDDEGYGGGDDEVDNFQGIDTTQYDISHDFGPAWSFGNVPLDNDDDEIGRASCRERVF